MTLDGFQCLIGAAIVQEPHAFRCPKCLLDRAKRALGIENAFDKRRISRHKRCRQRISWANFHKVLQAHVGPKHREHVLDIGAGHGSVTVGFIGRLPIHRTQIWPRRIIGGRARNENRARAKNPIGIVRKAIALAEKTWHRTASIVVHVAP